MITAPTTSLGTCLKCRVAFLRVRHQDCRDTATTDLTQYLNDTVAEVEIKVVFIDEAAAEIIRIAAERGSSPEDALANIVRAGLVFEKIDRTPGERVMAERADGTLQHLAFD